MGPYVAPEHALHGRLQNAAYEAAERTGGEDNEMTEAADRQYSAISYAEGNGYGMRAYVATTSGMADGFGFVTVRVAWLQCQICGLILPGQYEGIR